ncbi:hypothetical protein CEXT_719451 [Caerostris extrusa]|uniref:Uncharacterized protein n=1 Tax=Caerostris extrusa TaxID=172846 RepID=A0AAV4U1C1_CAEEX|nr:hypothetical protein CEXT_719451 [Caerostris extrusa]
MKYGVLTYSEGRQSPNGSIIGEMKCGVLTYSEGRQFVNTKTRRMKCLSASLWMHGDIFNEDKSQEIEIHRRVYIVKSQLLMI